MRALSEDWGDGGDDNGGSPRTAARKWLKVTWDFPANAPTPSFFEIAIYNGSGPDDVDHYVVPLQTAPGADRLLVVSIAPTVSVTGIKAEVRSVYE